MNDEPEPIVISTRKGIDPSLWSGMVSRSSRTGEPCTIYDAKRTPTYAMGMPLPRRGRRCWDTGRRRQRITLRSRAARAGEEAHRRACIVWKGAVGMTRSCVTSCVTPMQTECETKCSTHGAAQLLVGKRLTSLPEEGLEPSPGCPDGILNPARLPIPPLRHPMACRLTRSCRFSRSNRGPANLAGDSLGRQFTWAQEHAET